jgi:hypothetical protein
MSLGCTLYPKWVKLLLYLEPHFLHSKHAVEEPLLLSHHRVSGLLQSGHLIELSLLKVKKARPPAEMKPKQKAAITRTPISRNTPRVASTTIERAEAPPDTYITFRR